VSAEDYPPLDEYGVIGDCRSAALVHRAGAIDWMCLPRFDSPWVFGRLIDWQRGGHLRLAADSAGVSSRRYDTDSNVLETRWLSGTGEANVYDFMPLHDGEAGRGVPDSLRLVRVVKPVRGTLDWTLDVQPAGDGTHERAPLESPSPGLLVSGTESARLAIHYPASFRSEPLDGGVRLRGTLGADDSAVVTLHHGDRAESAARLTAAEAIELRDATDRFWRSWLQRCTYKGPFARQVRRSVLFVKLMQYAPSGAFVAAPTTSLPESDGGSLNWDYRYTWLRDMSVAVTTLHQLGFHTEADDFMGWLDHSCQCEPSGFSMLYRVDGRADLHEEVLPHLDGYRESRPVRIGNAAAGQNQLDVFGELMEAAHTVWLREHHMPEGRRQFVLDMVDQVLRRWELPDMGIWESRSRPKRYVYSQSMCWVVLDRALQMDEALRMAPELRAKVEDVRARIDDAVLTRGFSESAGAFTQALDDDTLDASGLTVPLTGLVSADDPRVAATVSAVQHDLMRGGLVYRHFGEDSEFAKDEGAFLVCSFWLVDVLAQMGRQRDAEALLTRVTRCANDLGLLAEEFDTDRDTLAGNFPLMLSHLSLLAAILNVARHEPATP
jgi:GH15 family glucan-1,4-alpha-glucosidase